jgi:hypothetical protein
MVSFMNHQATSAHFVQIETIGIPGQTTSKGMSESTTWTKTRTILSSAMCLRKGPTGQAAAAGEEESRHKTLLWFFFSGRIFVYLHIPLAVVATAATSADVCSCQTGCIYAETASGRAQGAVTAAVCFPAMEALRSLFRPSLVAVLFSFHFLF